MPTYAYRCTVCQHAFDVHQGFHDDPLTVCPECEGRLRKVFSPVGVVFKGSGFYRTDARGASSASSPAPKSSTGSSEPTGSAGSSESSASSGSSSEPSAAKPATSSAKQPAATAS